MESTAGNSSILLLTDTQQGFLADPIYGGNKIWRRGR